MPVNTNTKTEWEIPAHTTYIIDPDTGLPTGSLSSPFETALPGWYYIGGERVTADGAQEITLRQGTTAFVIEAEGGAIYYSVNGVTASANDSYIPEDGMRCVGPMVNLARLWVYGGSATTYAHIQFWREE